MVKTWLKMAIKDVNKSMLVRIMNMSMSYFPVSTYGLPPDRIPMHVETGASAQSVQAHARSRDVVQSALPFATQTLVF